MSDPLFQPFRALGYITDATPFAVQRRGKETWATFSVGKSWQVYNCAKLTLTLVGPQLPANITALACKGELTYAAVGADIVVCKRVHRVATWSGHRAPIVQLLVFGDFLLSLGRDGRLAVWSLDQVTLDPLKHIQFEAGFDPTCMAHPPTYLNKVLVGARDGRLQLWNVSTAALLFTFPGFGASVRCLEPSPALDVVGVGLADGSVALLNVRFDELLMKFENASGVGAGEAVLIGGGVGQAKGAGGGAVTSISFRTGVGAPLMAAGGGAGAVTVWNLEDRKLSTVIRDAHGAPISRLHFFQGEPVLMSAGGDNAVRHWIFDNADGTARLLRYRSGHASPPLHVRYYGEEGTVLLTAAEDRAVRVFSVIQDQQSRELSQNHTKQRAKRLRVREQDLKLPPAVDMSASSMRERDWANLLTAHAGDSTAYTWQLAKYKLANEELALPPKERLDGTQPAPVTAVFVSHCGNFGFVGTSAGRMDRYNMQSGLHRGAYRRPSAAPGDPPLPAHASVVVGIGADARNRRLVSAEHSGVLRVWGFKAGNVLAEVTVGSAVVKLAMHAHSMLAAAACADFAVRVYDVERACCVRQFVGHTDRLTDVVVSADARWVLSASMDGTVRVWDVPAAACLQAMRLGSPVASVSLSPNMELLATAHVNRRGVYLWSNQMLFGSGGGIMPSTAPVDVHMPTVATGHRVGDAGDEDGEVGAEVLGEGFGSDVDDDSDDEGEGSEQTRHAESDDDEAAEAAGKAASYRDADAAGVPVPIEGSLVTLSGLPASQWESLVHLDVIKARNKPLQPPVKPEAAPFFLPTASTVQGPKLLTARGGDAPPGPAHDPFAEDSLTMGDPASLDRLDGGADASPSPSGAPDVRARPRGPRAGSPLVDLLQAGFSSGDYAAATAWLRGASAATVDRELRALLLLPPYNEEDVHQLALVLDYLLSQLASGANFDHAQGLLSLVLQLHGDSIAEVPRLSATAQQIYTQLAQAWSQLDDDVHALRCMIGFYGNTQF